MMSFIIMIIYICLIRFVLHHIISSFNTTLIVAHTPYCELWCYTFLFLSVFSARSVLQPYGRLVTPWDCVRAIFFSSTLIAFISLTNDRLTTMKSILLYVCISSNWICFEIRPFGGNNAHQVDAESGWNILRSSICEPTLILLTGKCSCRHSCRRLIFNENIKRVKQQVFGAFIRIFSPSNLLQFIIVFERYSTRLVSIH